jgi:stage II sporulation protein AA (anti-sigma F factor antagonist)
MQIEKIERGDIGILQTSGRIDAATCGVFEKNLREFIDKQKMRVWLIDLSQVSMLSSGALRVLLSLAKRLKGGGPAVALCAPNANVREVLEISRFDAIFPIHATIAEGLIEYRVALPTPVAETRSAPPPLDLILGDKVYPCAAGDILGREGTVATEYFANHGALEPRHLMVGFREGKWFVLVPLNVRSAVLLDRKRIEPGKPHVLQGPVHTLKLGRLNVKLRFRTGDSSDDSGLEGSPGKLGVAVAGER